jgi:hypothetical protein
MQELQDSAVDACIARAVKAESTVSLSQMQRARESLFRKAAQQTMLPPVAPSMFERLAGWLRNWTRSSAVSLYQFVADDTAYRRIQRNDFGLSQHRYNFRIFSTTEFMLFA